MFLNSLSSFVGREHDACGLFATMNKSARPSRAPIEMGIDALAALRHRAGYVAGEGDGCGILMDLPATLWRAWLLEEGLRSQVLDDEDFTVGHLLLSDADTRNVADVIAEITACLERQGLNVLICREGDVQRSVLGPLARAEQVAFLQLAAVIPGSERPRVKRQLEAECGVHVASLSHDTVVYKVVGDAHTLWSFYGDLQNPLCETAFSLVHTRYSTNTKTSFARVQPFSVLGHNGEINTITRFQTEAEMIGVQVPDTMSDSQMVNEVVESLVQERAWSLFEAAELIFPPIMHEIRKMPEEMGNVYRYFRALWGPFSQGPAGMILRVGDEAVLSVDAMGLRPLWVVETTDTFCASSEQGIVPPSEWVANPHPLSPGEKVGFRWTDAGLKMFPYDAFRHEVVHAARARFGSAIDERLGVVPLSGETHELARSLQKKPVGVRAAAFGWRDDDVKILEQQVATGSEPIRSLGYDGPLAALRDGASTVSDYLHETVAVVTNPAIDREREIEHFSTRAVLGPRPWLVSTPASGKRLELPSPLLMELLPSTDEVDHATIQMLAARHGTLLLEDVLSVLHQDGGGTVELLVVRHPGESIRDCLDRICEQAAQAVKTGAQTILLDDRLQFHRGQHIDISLVIGAVHRALASEQQGIPFAESIRRRASLVVRSSGLRNLHDIMVALGLGAEAVDPVLMWEMAVDRGGVQGLENLYKTLCKGMEKVVSTLGIHELRGYDRLFSAIGLHAEVAEVLGVNSALSGPDSGLTFAELETYDETYQALYASEDERIVARQKDFRLYPRVWRIAGQVADGSLSYREYAEKLEQLEQTSPINVRHLLSLQAVGQVPDDAGAVDPMDTSVDIHDYPLVISSMSFGSQGEIAYRAYAEAAKQLNIVAMNGEGGEPKDILTSYPRNRGRQIASGRFGVNAALCNNAYVLEIKIGQGAKPGEGGHLPGSKVTELVASARNATPGTDLISPSNHHDIYSIEDLAEVIYELRMVNPEVRVAVKVPVVPNIGTIGVGIAKAGADVVVLSGFDGGTGAARAHALQRVGLPVDIGIRRVHDALCDAGLRNQVEIWADGGMKSALDAMKAILLGANRVGFGTMAMVALGCTACRACHKDTCHVGIATQIASVEEANAKGLPKFVPQQMNPAVTHLVRFFGEIGAELKRLTAALGASRTQDLVGRTDLLRQVQASEKLNLAELLTVPATYRGLGSNVRYRSQQELYASDADRVTEEAAMSTAHVVGETTTSQSASTWSGGKVAGSPAGPGGIAGQQTHRSRPAVYGLERAMGTPQSGELVREKREGEGRVHVVTPGVGGNGFAAYQVAGVHAVAHGGAQDGVAKGAFGGRTIVLKARGARGEWLGGSVGKSLAYGASHGLVIVQGDADARAGVRLSGADLVIGGEPHEFIRGKRAFAGSGSNLKGFAFEYMTAGRVVVLGDPGPWICSGMTGGRVYLRHDVSLGLTEELLRARIAKGARVKLTTIDRQGELDIADLLLAYHRELRQSGQQEAARRLSPLLVNPAENFRMVQPSTEQTAQDVATE